MATPSTDLLSAHDAAAAERERLRGLLRDCAEKLYLALVASGNPRATVEASVGPYFAALGLPVPGREADRV